MNKKAGVLETLVFIFLFLLLLVGIFEVVLFIYAYTHADEVECNLIWCTFKTTRQNISQSRICMLNNEEINCSDIDTETINKIYENYLNQSMQNEEN